MKRIRVAKNRQKSWKISTKINQNHENVIHFSKKIFHIRCVSHCFPIEKASRQDCMHMILQSIDIIKSGNNVGYTVFILLTMNYENALCTVNNITDGNRFYLQFLVLDNFNLASRDTDNILYQKYKSKYVWIFIMILKNSKIFFCFHLFMPC